MDGARRELERVTAGSGLQLDETLDDDGNLIRSGCVPGSNWRFWLTAHLDADEVEYGEITLSVAMDNRLGTLHLVYDPDADAPYLTDLGADLYARDADGPSREWMRETVERLGASFKRRVLAFMRASDHYALTLSGHGYARVTVAFLDEDEDEEDTEAEPAPNLPAEIAALDAIAAMIETQVPDAFVLCRRCDGRFNAAASPRCPHCGAPVGA